MDHAKKVEGNQRTLVVIAVIFFVCLANNLVIGEAMDANDGPGFLLGLAIGTCAAQLNLISIWAAISPGSPIVRLPISCLLLTFMWFSLVLGNRLAGGIDAQAVSQLGVVLLVCCAVAQIPLWIASRVFGWRFTRSLGNHDEHARFNLSEMFIATILIAGALALVRVLLPTDASDFTFVIEPQLITLLSVLTVVNLITVLPSIWATFVWNASLVTAIKVVIGLTVITLVEVGAVFAILGSGPEPGEVIPVFLAINLGQVGIVWGALWLLKWVGYDLVRVHEMDYANETSV